MKQPVRSDRSKVRSAYQALANPRLRERSYAKPRVEPAGSVFRRTRVIGPGTKDSVISGSGLL